VRVCVLCVGRFSVTTSGQKSGFQLLCGYTSTPICSRALGHPYLSMRKAMLNADVNPLAYTASSPSLRASDGSSPSVNSDDVFVAC